MLVRIWNRGNTYSLLVEVQTCKTTMEISMVLLGKPGLDLPQFIEIICMSTHAKYVPWVFL